MVVKLYIWNIKSSWGHVSMALEDGFYISWRPTYQVEKSPVNATEWVLAREQQTLQDDIRAEYGRLPVHAIKIIHQILDEDKIKRWWLKFKANNRYNLLTCNSSTVVYFAMREGGALDHVIDRQPRWWTPEDIKAFGEAVCFGYKTKGKAGVSFSPSDQQFVSHLGKVTSAGMVNSFLST
ncbi:uncharacterized protein LOC117338418 [Pecten maximus]|uniref:uncharacterized protein LOC117338418 n=1 Tax=Pecten maximus TaxID=6579 RepID=UPI00145910B4|nr:uncharacterized protein LOC117338418 [Pecten maximus]